MATQRDDRPAVGTLGVAAGVVGLGGLLLLDLVLGQTYFGVNGPELRAGLLVGATIPLARQRLLLASLLAVAISLGTSYLLNRSHGSAFGTRMVLRQRDGWPGMAEAAGLLLLLCWSLRALVAPAALAVTVGVGACFVAIVRVRNDIGYDRLSSSPTASASPWRLGRGCTCDGSIMSAAATSASSVSRNGSPSPGSSTTSSPTTSPASSCKPRLRRPCGPNSPRSLPTPSPRIEAAGAEALASMRRLVGTLRDDEAGPLAPAATLDDLQDLADRSSAMGLPVHLHVDGVDELPPSVAPSIHRVVGEAINNAQRHATGATAVEVRLQVAGGELTVEVDDDGDAPRAARSGAPGYGLTGMAERIEALGGQFEAGPVAGGGWRIRARLPLGRIA